MDKYTKPVENGISTYKKIKLGIMIAFIISIFLYYLCCGKINFSIQKLQNHRENLNFKQLMQSAYQKFYNVREYLISTIIMLILIFLLKRSNEAWEQNNLKKQQDLISKKMDSKDSKSLENDLSVIKEEKVEEDEN